jgi:hypothetical protein
MRNQVIERQEDSLSFVFKVGEKGKIGLFPSETAYTQIVIECLLDSKEDVIFGKGCSSSEGFPSASAYSNATCVLSVCNSAFILHVDLKTTQSLHLREEEPQRIFLMKKVYSYEKLSLVFHRVCLDGGRTIFEVASLSVSRIIFFSTPSWKPSYLYILNIFVGLTGRKRRSCVVVSDSQSISSSILKESQENVCHVLNLRKGPPFHD